ncbi:MAG: hypothetical protein Q4A27_02285 [bacterium]|nr:hypothetical protein [bacterium]
MKDIAKNLKLIAKDRLMLFLVAFVFIIGIIFFISTMFGVEYYDRMIYVRYTIFSGEHFYKDYWFTRIFLASLGLIVAFVHNLIIAKIYAVSGRKMAIFFTAMTLLLTFIGFLIAAAILREIPN